MKILVIGFALVAAGCAAGGGGRHAEHVAPAPAAETTDGESMGGQAGGPEHQPEVVHAGKSFRLGYAEASARYQKGERCGGDNAPDQVLGAPDQRNEMQMGRDHVVTYGFRFPQGTLLIRCRADHVEVHRRCRRWWLRLHAERRRGRGVQPAHQRPQVRPKVAIACHRAKDELRPRLIQRGLGREDVEQGGGADRVPLLLNAQVLLGGHDRLLLDLDLLLQRLQSRDVLDDVLLRRELRVAKRGPGVVEGDTGRN